MGELGDEGALVCAEFDGEQKGTLGGLTQPVQHDRQQPNAPAEPGDVSVMRGWMKTVMNRTSFPSGGGDEVVWVE